MSSGLRGSVMLALALVLAGCASGADSDNRVAPQSNETTGNDRLAAIELTVIDDELNPVVGAGIGLVGDSGSQPVELRSDDQGRASASGLLPGQYTVFIERLGFESKAQRIELGPGRSTEVTVTLVPIRVVEVFHGTDILTGFIGCSVTVIYPAGSPSYTAWACGDTVSNQAWYPNHDPYVEWEIPKGVETLLLELWWEPTSSGSDELRWQVAQSLDCYLNLCFVGADYQSQGGPRPLVYRLEDGDGLPDSLPSPFISRVTSGPTDTTNPVRLVLDQPFDQYTTNWFGGLAPTDWSGVPPQ